MASPIDPLTVEMKVFDARKKRDRRRDVHELSFGEKLQAECRGRSWWLRVPFVLVLVWSFIGNIFGDNNFALLDWVTIMLHRTGHSIGEFVAGDRVLFLGGIFLQLLVPLAVIEICRRKTSRFYIAIACGWFSSNLLWLSVYAEGAADRVFPAGLEGEAVHDWYYILDSLNLIGLSNGVANLLYFAGLIAMSACIYVCLYQFYFMIRFEEHRIGTRRAVRKESSEGVENYRVLRWRER